MSIPASLGLSAVNPGCWSVQSGWNNAEDGALLESINPTTGALLGTVRCATAIDYQRVVSSAR